MKWKLILLVVIPFVAAWGCGEDAKQPAPPPPPPPAVPAPAPSGPAERPKASPADVAEAVRGNNQFAVDLYAKLAAEKKDGNLFFSPLSISTALSMTYAGARANTAAEMKKALHFALADEKLHPAMAALIGDLNAAGKAGGFQLSVANALWGQKGHLFLPEFLALNQASYGAGLETVDFAGDAEGARKTINAWGAKQTQDKVKQLIKPGALGALTSLVLTNAVYFKGEWAAKFDKTRTSDEAFKTAADKQVTVSMMEQERKLNYAEEDGFKALELPYVGERLSMVILLPKEIAGIGELERSLSPASLAKWLSHLTVRSVWVKLPRLAMTCGSGLRDALRALGAKDAFALPPADFSGISGAKDVFISAVLHEASIDVNEEGTEGAAGTAVVIYKNGDTPAMFRADHPFLFLIRDKKTGSILFLGRVTNPK